jgi:hypothetical protein
LNSRKLFINSNHVNGEKMTKLSNHCLCDNCSGDDCESGREYALERIDNSLDKNKFIKWLDEYDYTEEGITPRDLIRHIKTAINDGEFK